MKKIIFIIIAVFFILLLMGWFFYPKQSCSVKAFPGASYRCCQCLGFEKMIFFGIHPQTICYGLPFNCQKHSIRQPILPPSSLNQSN